MKKRFLFPALLFIFIAIIFTIGCTNHLLKPHQSDPSILVKLEKSSGRNVTTGDYQITTWIENRDGTESHHQNLNSASGEETSLIFDNLVIGSQINIHLELTKNDDNQTKLTGESDWITVKEGEQVIEIPLESQANTDDSGEGNGEGGSNSDDGTGDDGEDPASGTPGEGDEKLVLTSFEVQYDPNQYQLVNTNINLSNITITQLFNNGSTKEVKASEVSNDYIIAFADGVDTNNAIGNVPATVIHAETKKETTVTIPVKYELNANNLTISGDSSVEQNKDLKLTAEYKVDGNDSYNLYTSASSSGSYKIIENVTISWTGATAQSNPWEANANTASTGSQTATVTLTPKDEWCVTTGGITASHTYTVTAITQTYSIGDEYRDDSGSLKGYVFEVNDSYIKIVATNDSWNYSWCGSSNNITDWGAVSTITDGQAMYNKMAENTNVIDNNTTIFYYAKTQKNETDSGWYIPTKDELNAVFNMNKTHRKVSGLSGDYWSSSIASITGDYTAYYVSIADDGTISSGTAAVVLNKNVIVVKKIDL